MRLHVFLARAGIASRRACEQFIRNGRVRVNDEPVSAMGYIVDEGDRVTFDGRLVRPLEKKIYLAVHKPIRVLCTQHDERGRKKVIDLLPPELVHGLFHVGRLDFMSSGLVFYTNDGDFAAIVTHPSHGIEKEYLLEAENDLPDRMLAHYQRGIEIDGEKLGCVRYKTDSKRIARLVLVQGKNREIRRVCDEYGVKVKRLVRVRIGPVELGRLAYGAFRHLNEGERGWFFRRGHDKQGRAKGPGLDQLKSL